MVNWNADNTTPGGPTSEEVLLRWLGSAENQEHWQHECHGTLCDEIVRELQALGITTRSVGAIGHKISRMKTQCTAVDKWLSKTGQYTLYHSGAATQKVKDGVLRRFQHYDTLAPMFGTVDTENLQTPKRPTSREDGMGTKKQRTTDTVAAIETPSSTESDDQVALSSLPLERALSPLSMQEHTSSALDMFTVRTAGLFDVQEAKHVSFLGKEGKQRLVECEVQRQKDLAKCHLEGEQKREELRTMREKLISRHECLGAGVPKELVDKAMPS